MKKSISLIVSVFVMLIISMIGFNAFADDEGIAIDDTNTEVVLSYTSASYTGNERKPGATVIYTDPDTHEEKVLRKNKEYTVVYENNINAGEASAVISGVGAYSGTVTASYTINPIEIKDSRAFDVKLSFTKTVFNGEAQKPEVKVYWIHNDNKILLKNKRDYQLKYSKNTNIGKADVIITGVNNFTSSLTKQFRILPKKMSGLKIRSVTDTAVTFVWSKQSYITGYQLFKYDSAKKKYVWVANIPAKNESYTLENLSSAYGRVFKIRSYKLTDDGTKLYGEMSSLVKAATTPKKIVLSNVGKSGSSKIKVSWGKVKCTGYQLCYSRNKSFSKNVKTVYIKKADKTSYTIKDVNNKKTYYVKVRAYYNYNGKTYFGKYSQYLSTYYTNLYATYYSYYENNPNRTTNLKLASKAITGTIIQPGETFSFNEVVGPRTASKGYKSAHVFAGDQVVNGVGGGICQVASTMFNCALLSNVKIVERHQHSQRVAYVPLGRDAAIFGSSEDFKWKNNTKYPIKIVMTVKDGIIRCSFYTCESAKPEKVSISVTQNGNHFKMKRTVKGKVNYSCSSTY